jgi:hypothetical protein
MSKGYSFRVIIFNVQALYIVTRMVYRVFTHFYLLTQSILAHF